MSSVKRFLGAFTPVLAGMCAVFLFQQYAPRRPVRDGITFGFNEGMPTISPEVARVISFGYAPALSSLLWIRFLQFVPVEKVPANSLSWIYFDLDAISALDPNFLPVFRSGGIFLSVITEDKEGARRILTRGAELHPDNWQILGNLAYHYQFELKDPEKAGPLFYAASKLPGAPPVFTVFGASYLQREQSADASAAFLREMIAATPDEKVKKRLNAKLERVLQDHRTEKGASVE